MTEIKNEINKYVDKHSMLPKITENQEMEVTAFEKYTMEMEMSESVRKEIMLGKRVGLYRIKGNLGNGNFSQVKLAVHLLTKEEVAIKILDKTKLDAKTQRLLSREISSMEKLHHPNVIRLYEVIEDFHKMHIVMEYASGGELHSMIVNQGRIPEPIAKMIFAQVVAAIGHLHSQKVIHRDLKAENIFFAGNKPQSSIPVGPESTSLPTKSSETNNNKSTNNTTGRSHEDICRHSNDLNNNNQQSTESATVSNTVTPSEYCSMSRYFHVKLGDFGFSTMAEPMEKLRTFCGSPPYAAPELFQADWYHGIWVDVWALGVLLYFMLVGCMPFRGESVSILKKLIISGQFSCPSWMPPVAKQLVLSLLKQEPSQRLNIHQIKQHPWLEGQSFADAFEPFKPTPSVPEVETISAQKLIPINDSAATDNESSISSTVPPTTTNESENDVSPLTNENDSNEDSVTNDNRDDIEAAKMLLRLGITDKHIEVAQAQAVRNYVTGTYRIMLHRVHKNRRLSHIPHSLSNPELGHKYLNSKRNKSNNPRNQTNTTNNNTRNNNKLAINQRQKSKLSTQSDYGPSNDKTNNCGNEKSSKMCNVL